VITRPNRRDREITKITEDRPGWSTPSFAMIAGGHPAPA
jgi:hypothetical protein